MKQLIAKLTAGEKVVISLLLFLSANASIGTIHTLFF